MANTDKPDLRVVATDGVAKIDAASRPTLNPDMSDRTSGTNGMASASDPSGPSDAMQTAGAAPPKFNLSEIESLVKSAKNPEPAAPPPGVAAGFAPAAPANEAATAYSAQPTQAPPPKRDYTPGYDDPLPPRQTHIPKPTRLGPAPDDKSYYNYIFTVGRPGSGKTTFQSHMLRYLHSGGEHVVEADPVLAQSNVEFRDLFLEWEDQWRRGHFPRRSEVGRPLDFRYIVTPNTDGFPPLPFGFLEISGEDFIQLAQKSVAGKPPELLRSIDEFLNNPRIKIAFLFVCQGQDLRGDDLLFSQFLEYIKIKIGRGFENQCSAVLVIADPETCQRRLAMKLKRPELADAPLDIDTFIRHFLPASAAKLARWKHRATIATFSVGTIVEGKNAEGKPIPIISDASFDDAKLIYDWLYHCFTNRRIGVEEGFVPKVKEWLSKLAKLGGAG